MKRLVPSFLVLIFLVGCNRNKVPDGILQRDEMVSVLVDIHLVDGFLFSWAQDSMSAAQQLENIKRQREALKQGGTHFKQQRDSLNRLSDRWGQQVDSLNKQSSQQQADIFYNTVYKKHHTSKAQFKESLRYYSKQPNLLDSMYSQVSADLEKKYKRETEILNRKNRK